MIPFTSDMAFIPLAKKQGDLSDLDVDPKNIRNLQEEHPGITDELKRYINNRESFYIAFHPKAGRIYVQHRGGPKGFLKVLDEHTLAFADYSTDNQYNSAEQIAGAQNVQLFLADYSNSIRIKIWGEATVVDPSGSLLELVQEEDFHTHIVRIIKIKVTDWEVKGRLPRRLVQCLERIGSDLESLQYRIQELKKHIT